MAEQFVTILISLGISLLPSISAFALSTIISNFNSATNRRHAIEADPDQSLIQTVELIRDTLYDAEQWEIKDRSFKLWFKKLKKIAHEAEDLLHEYGQYEARFVRMETRHMQQYILPIPDGIVVRFNQIRSRFDELERERQYLQLSKTDEVGYVADEMEVRGDWHICREKSKTKVVDIDMGYVADEGEIRDHGVTHAAESDEVENIGEESEMRGRVLVELSKKNEVGFSSEERDIKDPGAQPLSLGDEVVLAAEEREIRDHSEFRRVAYNAVDVQYQNEETLVRVEPLQLNSNSSRERLDVLNDGTTEHFERLMSYAEGSIAFLCTLALTMFMSGLMEEGNPIFIRATQLCCIFSALSNLVVKKLSEDAHTLSRSGFRHQCKDLYIFIYGSTFMLMLCGLCFLVLSNGNYGPLGTFPAVALIIMIGLFHRGYELGHTQSATSYRKHDGKLKYYYEFSSACTMTTYVGLLTYISSSPTPHQNGNVRLAEIALYIAAVTSLLLRQLTTVPPAVSDDNMRARVMEAMRYLSYIIVGLLFSVALLATGTVLRGVISILIYIAGTMIFLVVIVMNELKVQATNTPVVHTELASHAIGVADLTFGALLGVYSKYINGSTKVDGHYFLLLLCMVCLCSAFIMSLSKALLGSDGTAPGARPRFNMIPSYTSYAVRCIAVIALLLLQSKVA